MMNDERGMVNQDLKPCPFCGETKGIKVWQLPPDPDYDDKKLWAVKCVDGCSTGLYGYTSRPAAIAAWNRRPEQAAAQARALEALRVAAEAVIEQVDIRLDRAPLYPGEDLFEAILSYREIEALRAALQEVAAYPTQGNDDDSELLDWLEAQMQKSLGTGLWYEAACDVHLGKPLRQALTEVMLEEKQQPQQD